MPKVLLQQRSVRSLSNRDACDQHARAHSMRVMFHVQPCPYQAASKHETETLEHTESPEPPSMAQAGNRAVRTSLHA